MKKFKQLSKNEMKNVLGGTGTCTVMCGEFGGDFGHEGYSYTVPNCSDVPSPMCPDGYSPQICNCPGA